MVQVLAIPVADAIDREPRLGYAAMKHPHGKPISGICDAIHSNSRDQAGKALAS